MPLWKIQREFSMKWILKRAGESLKWNASFYWQFWEINRAFHQGTWSANVMRQMVQSYFRSFREKREMRNRSEVIPSFPKTFRFICCPTRTTCLCAVFCYYSWHVAYNMRPPIPGPNIPYQAPTYHNRPRHFRLLFSRVMMKTEVGMLVNRTFFSNL